MTTTTAALYARVSTLDQKCEMQLRELRDYVKRRGWKIAGEYVDTGWSGAKASRPAFDRLKAAAAKHLFDSVLVWKLDRFGRSVLNCVQGIQDLDRAGVRFLAISQNIDTDQSSPTSRFMLTILAAVAELEREMIRERVMAGLKNARAKGVRLGRRAVVVDRVRAAEMHGRGMSIRQIAGKLGVSRSVAHKAINATPNGVR